VKGIKKMKFTRKPVISASATRYLLIMVISFATSVVATRLYLEATGYPQIGNATFHFAHALWGGLLQLIAALLLLVFVNQWIFSLSAVLAGVGIGLFVDEVGKFITQQNDYFFPLAAPIIYIVFLLTLLIYLIVKRQSSTNARADMYRILHELEEVLEADLSFSERAELLDRLSRVQKQTERQDLAALAEHISAFLKSDAIKIVQNQSSVRERLFSQFIRLENRFVSHKLARRVLVLIYFVSSFITVANLLLLAAGLSGDQNFLSDLLKIFIMQESNISGAISLNWYWIMIILNLIAGILLLMGLVAFLRTKDNTAITLGIIALIITLTFINTLSFYFHQFSILLNSIVTFFALLALQRYRDRFLHENAS